MSIEHIGQRLKSDKDIVAFKRFPLSDEIYTIPAGKPTPKINSFLASGFYELEPPEGMQENIYIEKSVNVDVVPPEASDDSSTLNGWFTGLYDVYNNTFTKAEKQTEYIEEGFEKSVAGLKTDVLDFSEKLKPLYYLAGGIVLLLILSNLKSLFK